MPELLAPKLKAITVPYDKLVLDPNNPRFITRTEDQIAEDAFLDQDMTGQTKKKLDPEGKDTYKIKELISSIKQNGWQAVDYIFVKELKGSDNRYVVLEGNRRVTAIREIMNDDEAPSELKQSLAAIDVMQVLEVGSAEDLKKKISYLLGVRHHGSLKKWTPFAQAHNIWIRYLELAGQKPETFQWKKEVGQKVADTLSIQDEEVQQRLQVYRVMSQLGSSTLIKDSAGGMEDRYYSICAAPILSPGKSLAAYVPQDPHTFLLGDQGLARMNNLCHFSEKSRAGAPLKNPQEWRALDKILSDEDVDKRESNLKQVEEDPKRAPSDVWAERAVELAKLTWSKWLFQTTSILKTVSLGDDFDTDLARTTAARLVALIEQLDRGDLH